MDIDLPARKASRVRRDYNQLLLRSERPRPLVLDSKYAGHDPNLKTGHFQNGGEGTIKDAVQSCSSIKILWAWHQALRNPRKDDQAIIYWCLSPGHILRVERYVMVTLQGH